MVSYTLLLSLVELKARVARDDLEGALALLPSIPQVGAGAEGRRVNRPKRATPTLLPLACPPHSPCCRPTLSPREAAGAAGVHRGS